MIIVLVFVEKEESTKKKTDDLVDEVEVESHAIHAACRIGTRRSVLWIRVLDSSTPTCKVSHDVCPGLEPVPHLRDDHLVCRSVFIYQAGVHVGAQLFLQMLRRLSCERPLPLRGAALLVERTTARTVVFTGMCIISLARRRNEK